MDDLNFGDLERFIEGALEKADSVGRSGKSLSEEQLREVALRYGISEAKWAAICHEADDHRTRGLNFLDAKNWDDAIAELEKALVVMPYDTELRYRLGTAYTGQYRETGNQTDRARAEELFRQCLVHEPGHVDAVRTLTELEQSEKKGGSRKPLLIAAAALGLGLLGWVVLTYRPVPKEPEFSKNETPESKTGEAPETNDKPVTGTTREMIPVEFPVADLGEFEFDTRSSILTRYDGKFAYEMKGTVLPREIEIEKMIGRVELIGEENRVVASARLEAHAGYNSPALPGDSLPVRALIFENRTAPGIQAARIILTETETLPFEGEAKPGAVRKEVASIELPPDYGVEICERNVIRSKAALSDQGKAQVRVVLTVKNTGRRGISRMKIEMEVFDIEGDKLPLGNSSIIDSLAKKGLIESSPGTISVIGSIHPTLVPGERRVVDSRIYIPDADADDIGEYRISGISVE